MSTDDIGHTWKGAAIKYMDGVLWVLLLLHKPREDTAEQRSGSTFREWLRWGMYGGQSKPREDGLKTLNREAAEETLDINGNHITITKEMWAESVIVDGPVKRSQRKDGPDRFQNHFVLTIFPPDTEIGKMVPTNLEIAEARWFPLTEDEDVLRWLPVPDKLRLSDLELPMPDDDPPWTMTQVFAFEELLDKAAEKWPGANGVAALVRKWIDSYEKRNALQKKQRRY
jgi:hypothetical protein